MPPHRPRYGAYGLALAGAAPELLVPAPAGWAPWRLVRRVGEAAHAADELTDERAVVVFRHGGEVEIERERARATFTLPFALPDADLAHPYLAPVAAIVSRWLGRAPLHGGAFVAGNGAWGVLADREGGKSSLLAALAREGYAIVSDDLLVTDGSTVCAGPRALDLRAAAAARLGLGTPLGLVGARERWRVQLPEVAAFVPLRGWIFPAWSGEVRADAVPVQERLRRLTAARAVARPPDARLLLRLASLPGYELRRPQDWDALPATLGTLLEAIAGVRDASHAD